MQTRIRTILACLLLAVAAMASAADMKWGASYKAALAQAKKTNKLVMVDFYADY
jgi:thiol:disulfide interchange protein